MANTIDFRAADFVADTTAATDRKREPLEMAVLMGTDAMRICMNIAPVTYTHDEVIRWMNALRGERGLQAAKSTRAANMESKS